MAKSLKSQLRDIERNLVRETNKMVKRANKKITLGIILTNTCRNMKHKVFSISASFPNINSGLLFPKYFFIHAENPDKTLYDINDIESGCGFELDKFLTSNNHDKFLSLIIDIIEEHNFTEFNNLVRYARTENPQLLNLIMDKTYFFAKYLDSRRYARRE